MYMKGLSDRGLAEAIDTTRQLLENAAELRMANQQRRLDRELQIAISIKRQRERAGTWNPYEDGDLATELRADDEWQFHTMAQSAQDAFYAAQRDCPEYCNHDGRCADERAAVHRMEAQAEGAWLRSAEAGDGSDDLELEREAMDPGLQAMRDRRTHEFEAHWTAGDVR